MKNTWKFLGAAVLVSILSFTTPESKKRIVIDAGHGGQDIGATHGFYSEKQIVSNIAKQIASQNRNTEIEIILTRDDDEFSSLQERTEKINKLQPDLVISLHVNKNTNEEANGIEAYVSEQNERFEASKAHAEELISVLSDNKLRSRGVKTAPMYLLKNTKSPAVLLELGFLSNANDRSYLSSNSGQKEIAQKILEYLAR